MLLKDHHPGYIAYEAFERNQQVLRSNEQMKRHDDQEHAGPPREGTALLQGLARCGGCGRKMYVGYGGSRPSASTRRTMQYRCSAARQRHEVEGKDCQIMGGKRIDDVVVEVFLQVTRGASAEAATLAAAQLARDGEEAERAWQLQIEKAIYEAERAERQFNAVEPEDRIVARTLESRWNACLKQVEDLKAKAQLHRQERRPLTELAPGAPWRIVLTEELRARITRGDAPAGWLGLSEASRELGLPKSQVAYLVKAGKLRAVRVVVGKRPCWRIDVSAGDFSKQKLRCSPRMTYFCSPEVDHPWNADLERTRSTEPPPEAPVCASPDARRERQRRLRQGRRRRPRSGS